MLDDIFCITYMIEICLNCIRSVQLVYFISTPFSLISLWMASNCVNSLSPESLPMGSMHISDSTQFYKNKLQPIETISCEQSAPPGLRNPRTIFLDPRTNNIFVVDSDNKRVVVLTIDWKVVSKFGEEKLDSPWGLVVHSNFVFVTDVNCHALFKFSQSDLSFISQTNSTDNKKLKEPRGISCNGNGDLFVADSGSHAISVFNTNLEFLRYIGSGVLWFPRDVKLLQDSVLTLDKSDTCVHLFSQEGEKKGSFIALDSERNSSPLFFYPDTCSNIILSDYEAKSLRIFDLAGNHLHTLKLSENPKGVVLVHDRLLCCYTNSIQIF